MHASDTQPNENKPEGAQSQLQHAKPTVKRQPHRHSPHRFANNVSPVPASKLAPQRRHSVFGPMSFLTTGLSRQQVYSIMPDEAVHVEFFHATAREKQRMISTVMTRSSAVVVPAQAACLEPIFKRMVRHIYTRFTIPALAGTEPHFDETKEAMDWEAIKQLTEDKIQAPEIFFMLALLKALHALIQNNHAALVANLQVIELFHGASNNWVLVLCHQHLKFLKLTGQTGELQIDHLEDLLTERSVEHDPRVIHSLKKEKIGTTPLSRIAKLPEACKQQAMDRPLTGSIGHALIVEESCQRILKAASNSKEAAHVAIIKFCNHTGGKFAYFPDAIELLTQLNDLDQIDLLLTKALRWASYVSILTINSSGFNIAESIKLLCKRYFELLEQQAHPYEKIISTMHIITAVAERNWYIMPAECFEPISLLLRLVYAWSQTRKKDDKRLLDKLKIKELIIQAKNNGTDENKTQAEKIMASIREWIASEETTRFDKCRIIEEVASWEGVFELTERLQWLETRLTLEPGEYNEEKEKFPVTHWQALRQHMLMNCVQGKRLTATGFYLSHPDLAREFCQLDNTDRASLSMLENVVDAVNDPGLLSQLYQTKLTPYQPQYINLYATIVKKTKDTASVITWQQVLTDINVEQYVRFTKEHLEALTHHWFDIVASFVEPGADISNARNVLDLPMEARTHPTLDIPLRQLARWNVQKKYFPFTLLPQLTPEQQAMFHRSEYGLQHEYSQWFDCLEALSGCEPSQEPTRP